MRYDIKDLCSKLLVCIDLLTGSAKEEFIVKIKESTDIKKLAPYVEQWYLYLTK